MTVIFTLGLAGLTSVGAYLLGLKGFRLPAQDFGLAVKKTLECAGATMLFFAINLIVAITIILAVRGFTGIFVSVYVTDDAVWLGLSLLQGLTFQWWRELSHRPSPSQGR